VQRKLVARAGNGDGSTKNNAKEITVNVAGWIDTAEEDCYYALSRRPRENLVSAYLIL
jgi:hypothetical protein